MNLLRQLERLIRSTIFVVGYVLATAFIGISAGLFLFWLPYKVVSKYILMWNRFTVWWFCLSCGVTIEVRGAENVSGKPVLILANHQSAWETYFLQLYFRPVTTVLKRELFRIPAFGWALRLMRPIAIDRSSPREALRQMMRQGQARLSDGMSVLIFPEGSRKLPGAKTKYARGGAGIAIAAGVDVIPVAHNAGSHWPARSFTKQPGTIVVSIGQPIKTDGRSAREITAMSQQWIETELAMIQTY
jgi:1-acyl-sn-glycerol-3-phosphate acyltransferase